MADTGMLVQTLLDYAQQKGLLDSADYHWAFNHVMALVQPGMPEVPACDAANQPGGWSADSPIEDVLHALYECACAQGMVQPSQAEEERLTCAIMDAVMPRPSQVDARFLELLQTEGAQAACAYLYQLCIDANYVHAAAIQRDIKWESPSEWGDLEITINLSKPEKDPRDIAKAVSAGSGSGSAQKYPACQLCLENEGYAGRLPGDADGTHPARQNLRVVRISLAGETWGFQYSPYAYFNEHCIVINPQHAPMHIDRSAFEHLLDFVDLFPQYFIGSNADLPIVGGSILSHDHYQAGAHVFPMDKAPVVQTFEMADFPQVSCGVVKWPVSVLRLQSPSRAQLLDAAVHILEAWRGYSNAAAGIFSETAGADGQVVYHNTITPFAHKTDQGYQLDLALRCNITSEEHPLGVFHPHAPLHHIKKENIGLIEVMGLAILPARLRRELAAVEQALLAGQTQEEMLQNLLTAAHTQWALDVRAVHPELSSENAHEILRAEVGAVFAQVLECSGVFKWDAAGRIALNDFLANL